jgi:antitoxin ParD1/3/4
MNQNLSLPDDLVRMIEARVETGDYASATEVVRDALASLDRQNRTEAEKRAWLQQAWREGLASPDIGAFDKDRFRREAHRRLSQKA